MSRFLGQCPGNHDSNSAPKSAVNRHTPRHYWPQTPQLNRHTSQMKTGIPASRLYPRQLCDTPPRPAPGQASQGNPSHLDGVLLISILRKLRNSSKNESQRRAAQNGCSLAGSLSSTRDCGGLGRVGNCAKLRNLRKARNTKDRGRRPGANNNG